MEADLKMLGPLLQINGLGTPFPVSLVNPWYTQRMW